MNSNIVEIRQLDEKSVLSFQPGAPNFGKTWGYWIICFNQGRPKVQNSGGLIHIERTMFQNLGVYFRAKLYQYIVVYIIGSEIFLQ